MPYFAVLKTDVESLSSYNLLIDYGYRPHASAPEALAPITDRSVYKIVFQATPEERDTWQERERDRLDDGTYKRTPWHSRDRYPDHYAHLSTIKPGLVAYTKSDEHGVSDRQTAVRPGRYLEEFYSDWPKDTRDRLTAECDVDLNTLSFARTPDEIETLYTSADHGSCMRHGVGYFNHRVNEHPVRVYGNSDLAVAYFGPLTACKGRAIVWPDQQVYTRIYGDTDRMRALLQHAGYTAGSEGSLDGAKIRRIDIGESDLLMPYIDWHSNCREHGRNSHWLVIDPDGPIDVQTTTGYTQREEPTACCDHCGDRYPANDDSGSYCDSCENDRSCCSLCSEDTWDTVSTEEHTLCADCARENVHTCAIEECDTEWYACDLSRQEQRRRQQEHTTDLCPGCADVYRGCADCDNVYDRSALQCPDCQLTPRCTHTPILPLNQSDDYPAVINETIAAVMSEESGVL